MFFDVKKKFDAERETACVESEALLMELAKRQNALYRSRCFVETEDIRTLKEKIRTLTDQNRMACGIYWWELSWKQVLEKLISDTELPSEMVTKDEWDWEYELVCEEIDEIQFLCLMEHGRKYGVDVRENSWEYNRDSKFSESEQKEMVRDYKKRIHNFEFYRAATTDGPVYSRLTDTTYDSMWEYYASLESWMIRDHFVDRYEKSLYQERWTHHLSAVSANVHSRKLYRVAGYHVTDGTLDFLQPEGFQLISSWGPDVSGNCLDVEEMDAAVLCAGFLAGADTVHSIPLTLLGKNLTQSAATYEAAMRQAELLVCLAEKICG